MAKIKLSNEPCGDKEGDTLEVRCIVSHGDIYCPTCWHGPKGLFKRERPYEEVYTMSSRWPAFSRNGPVCCKVCGHKPHERDTGTLGQVLKAWMRGA